MKTSSWNLLRDGKNSADYNMALDEALLELAPQIGAPILRFYGWAEPAATFGYSQHYADLEKMTMLRPLVRRPTGGGLVPHDADWTYSLVFSPEHEWYRAKATEGYRRVHQWIKDAFCKMNIPSTLAPMSQKEIPGQCFIGAEKDDVLWHGRKIAGAAQRRTKSGLLIQGSIQPPPLGLERSAWETAIRNVATEEFHIDWKELEINALLRERTEELRLVKYSQSAYNEKR
jgi:lipoate-protein ligase A